MHTTTEAITPSLLGATFPELLALSAVWLRPATTPRASTGKLRARDSATSAASRCKAHLNAACHPPSARGAHLALLSCTSAAAVPPPLSGPLRRPPRPPRLQAGEGGSLLRLGGQPPLADVDAVQELPDVLVPHLLTV